MSVSGNADDPGRAHEGQTIHARSEPNLHGEVHAGSARFLETGQGTANAWSISIPKGIVNTSSAVLMFLNAEIINKSAEQYIALG
jgi:hypothetical protein